MMFARSLRAETRNRAKDELKRAINSVEKVRTWEKKWIVIKDTTMKIYKWVPVTGDSAAAISTRKLVKPQTKVEDEDASRTVPDVSAENSQSGTGLSRLRTNFGMNEDSNTGFSETGFDSDSNQAFDGRRYQAGVGESTDFSALRQAELEDDADEPPAKRLKDM